ncbi:MAG TPA: beta-galactosidase [Terriglobia bacterium]|nr:beta-galactosidase [Terriglobia bacterium]
MKRRTFNKLASMAGLDALTRSGDRLEAHPPIITSSSIGLSASSDQVRPAREAEERKQPPWNRYLLGAAYYPEWWPASEWEADFAQMEQLGINTVRMGEFAWAIFEPAPGKFEFAWMDHAIALANRHGIDVVLGTPTASVPPWLYQQHPDVLSGDEIGPYTYGGRKGYCTSSPNYEAACARIVTALAGHYGHHDGVIGWQLDNEPGFPFEAYDPNSKRAFQDWPKKRYGALDELNRVWNGAFWSNKYSEWSQIDFPKNSAEGGWQPAISLAYRQFFSDSFLNHLRRQAVILRERSKHLISTNWPSATWSVDVFTAAEFLDAAAWDNYCIAPGLSEFQRQYISGFNHDFCRCAGPRQRFFCAEQIAYAPANALDEGLRLQAYIDLAHGSYGQIYFEWRRPYAGNEQYRPSMMKRFDGSINPAKPVFERVGKEFARLGPLLAGAVTQADIALIYDFTNQWSQGFWSVGQKGRHYDQEAMRYYNGFKVLQRNIDVVPVRAEFSEYTIILAPDLHLVDEATVARLRAFVTGGGILVLNYRAGAQNMDNTMRGVLPPGPFAKMAGAIAEADVDLIEYPILRSSALGIRFSGNTTMFRPRTILESLTLQGAEPVANFSGNRMAGRPAVTRNRSGRGWVFYVGTDSDDALFYEALALAAGSTGKLAPLIAAPYGVEVVSREDSQATYYFLLNLTDVPHEHIELPHPMDDLLAEHTSVTSAALGPLGVTVLASPKGATTKGSGSLHEN